MKRTVTLTITGTENGEWQGKVENAQKKSTEFQSVMELLKILNGELKEAQ